MNVQRGDVLKARFPHASGERGKAALDCPDSVGRKVVNAGLTPT